MGLPKTGGGGVLGSLKIEEGFGEKERVVFFEGLFILQCTLCVVSVVDTSQ